MHRSKAIIFEPGVLLKMIPTSWVKVCTLFKHFKIISLSTLFSMAFQWLPVGIIFV